VSILLKYLKEEDKTCHENKKMIIPLMISTQVPRRL